MAPEADPAPPIIAKLNKLHAVVALPNKVAIATFHRDRVEFFGEKNLKLLHKNRRLGNVGLAENWLQHKHRREYFNGVTFDPSGDKHGRKLNLWARMGREARPGGDCPLGFSPTCATRSVTAMPCHTIT